MMKSASMRWRAALTAAVLLLTGGVLGVLVDRVWLSPPDVHATPLTPDAMAARLRLSPAEEAHLRALLDSLHTEILAAVDQGPDSHRVAVRSAQNRIEAALPARAHSEFHAWLREHHDQVTGHRHGKGHGRTMDQQGARDHGRGEHGPDH